MSVCGGNQLEFKMLRFKCNLNFEVKQTEKTFSFIKFSPIYTFLNLFIFKLIYTHLNLVLYIHTHKHFRERETLNYL